MTKHPLWSDDYWLLLMRLYLRKPVGVKPLYSRALVDLSLELHIPPQNLYHLMFHLRQLDTPRIKRLWEQYGKNPKQLAKGIRLLKRMTGFNSSGGFYDGVDVQESFEKDFRPIPSYPTFRPIMLIMILDLYFRLTPITMVVDTPEVKQLARQIKVKPSDVEDVLGVFQTCDPYLQRKETSHPLTGICKEIWNRYGNGNPEELAALAAQLKMFFRRK